MRLLSVRARRGMLGLALGLALTSGCSPSSGADTGGSGGVAVAGTGGGSGGSSGEGSAGSGGGPGQGGTLGSGGASSGGASSGGAPGSGGAGEGGAPGADAGASGGASGGADGGPGPSMPPAGHIPQPTGPGKIVLVVGGGTGGDGSPAAMASTNKPFGVAVDPLSGEAYVAEYGGHRVRKIDGKGIITTIMGAGATGPGAKITLGQPHNLAFQPNTHNLFVADTFASRIVKMDLTSGETTVIPGEGRTFCISFDPEGEHLYMTGNGVAIIDLKTMAKTHVNTATPRVIAVDSKKNLYLGGGASLQVADPMGKVSAVMGSGGLAAPKHINIDLDDNVVIADTESNTVKRWMAATKTVVKLAGGGGGKGTLDGAPEMAGLARPHGVFVDAKGSIWIADSFNDRVLRIDY